MTMNADFCDDIEIPAIEFFTKNAIKIQLY
jgi:hypothetical protein